MAGEEGRARKGKLKAEDAEGMGEDESVGGGEKRAADGELMTDDKRYGGCFSCARPFLSQ